MPRRVISKYTKDTLHFISQPISFLIQKQTMLLLLAVAVTEIAFSSAAMGLPLFLSSLSENGESNEFLGFQLSFIMITYYIISLTTASFFGAFSDRYGRRPFLILGSALAGVSLIIFPVLFPVYSSLQFGFLILAFANGLKGLAVAMISGPVLAVIADLSPEEKHGETMGKFYLAKSVGGAIGSLIALPAWLLFKEGSFFIFAIIMFLATSIYLLRFFEPRRDTVLEDEAETMLTDFTQVPEDSDIDINPFKTMLDSLQDKQFRKFAIAWLCYCTLIGASAFVAPIIIYELFKEIGLVIAVVGFLGIVMMGALQPVFGRTSDNIGRKPFLVIGVVGTSMLLMTFVSIIDLENLTNLSELIQNPLSITETISFNLIPDFPLEIPHLFLVVMVIISALSASCFASSSLGLISDVTKSEHRGREMGLIQTLMAAGNIIGAIVGGYFVGLGRDGIIGVFSFSLILSLIAVVIIVYYLYETSGFYHFTHKLV